MQPMVNVPQGSGEGRKTGEWKRTRYFHLKIILKGYLFHWVEQLLTKAMCLASEVVWRGKEGPSTPGGKTQSENVQKCFYKQLTSCDVCIYSGGEKPAYFNLGRFLTFSPKAKRHPGGMGKETEWFRSCLQPGHWKIFALWNCHLLFLRISNFLWEFHWRWKRTWGNMRIWDKINSTLTTTEIILCWLGQERVPFTSELLVSFSVVVRHCMFCGQGAASSALLISAEHKKSRARTGRCYHSQNCVEAE